MNSNNSIRLVTASFLKFDFFEQKNRLLGPKGPHFFMFNVVYKTEQSQEQGGQKATSAEMDV